MAEVWKPVSRYPGVLASSEGRLLLPPRYAPLPNGGYRAYLPQPTLGVIARSAKDAKHEYRNCYALHYGNIKVHQAVCEAFHGPKPFPTAVVIHLDENGLNNAPSNLKWGTMLENMNAPGYLSYCQGRTGDNSPTAKAANRNKRESEAA